MIQIGCLVLEEQQGLTTIIPNAGPVPHAFQNWRRGAAMGAAPPTLAAAPSATTTATAAAKNHQGRRPRSRTRLARRWRHHRDALPSSQLGAATPPTVTAPDRARMGGTRTSCSHGGTASRCRPPPPPLAGIADGGPRHCAAADRYRHRHHGEVGSPA